MYQIMSLVSTLLARVQKVRYTYAYQPIQNKQFRFIFGGIWAQLKFIAFTLPLKEYPTTSRIKATFES